MSDDTQEIIARIWAISGYSIIAIIIVGSVLRYAKWALSALSALSIRLVKRMLQYLLREINQATKDGAEFLQRTTLFMIALPRMMLKIVFPAIWHFAVKLIKQWQAASARRRGALRMDPSWFGSGQAQDQPTGDAKEDPEPQAEADQSSSEPEAEPAVASSAYDDALALLGLTGVTPLTSTVLKQRYAELIRLVHPDRGCPSRVLAQQVNAAVMLIRRTHGWR